MSFETDFVPALRRFMSLILEGEYDIVGGCIRETAEECSGYKYVFQHSYTKELQQVSHSQTLIIEPIDMSSSAAVVTVDAVDDLFLASKTAFSVHAI